MSREYYYEIRTTNSFVVKSGFEVRILYGEGKQKTLFQRYYKEEFEQQSYVHGNMGHEEKEVEKVLGIARDELIDRGLING